MQIYYGCCSGNPVETIDILQKPLTMGGYAHPFRREKASVEEGESGKLQQWSVYRHFLGPNLGIFHFQESPSGPIIERLPFDIRPGSRHTIRQF
jgi:hypothetical protein